MCGARVACPHRFDAEQMVGCCCLHSIDFGEFLMVIKEQKAATAAAGDEGDTILAFVALGGKSDKTGIISAEKLRQTCKVRNTALHRRSGAHITGVRAHRENR